MCAYLVEWRSEVHGVQILESLPVVAERNVSVLPDSLRQTPHDRVVGQSRAPGTGLLELHQCPTEVEVLRQLEEQVHLHAVVLHCKHD